MSNARVAFAAAAAVLLAAATVSAAAVRVGPNILVSRDGDVAHCETMVAANPRDAKNLLGGSITLTRPDGGATNKAYASVDGGSTWFDASFPEEAEQGGGDPQVGFGATGTAYFTGISLSKGIYVSRSEDGGRTWSKGVWLGRGDHEQLATDHTTGRFAGRVYVADERDQAGGSNELEDLVMRRRVVLHRSSDDGRSFVGPIEVAKGNNTGLAVHNLQILSDGTLFVPLLEYPNYGVNKDADTWKVQFALSTDGGVTFSPPRPVTTVRFGGVKRMREMQKSGRVDQMGGPVFAADAGTGKFRDRLYVAWVELDGDRLRLRTRFSSDRGATWSQPRAIVSGDSSSSSQFQPMIVVNKDGALGVFWYDTAGNRERDRFDAYFTASLDGGETFLPPRRVSSETSVPFGPGNLKPGPFSRVDRGMLATYFLSGVARWVDGGDYIGMTADSDGVFHPFWADSRSGTYQLYTAPVRVEASPAKTSAGAAAASDRESASLVDKVALVFDPIRFDAAAKEMVVPVRLKNVSKETLYPPFRVEVKELVHPYTVKAKEEASVPRILNSANGKDGVGAVFDYGQALGDLESLLPDAVTNAVLWRLQASSAVKTDFYIGSEVTGFVEKKKEAAR